MTKPTNKERLAAKNAAAYQTRLLQGLEARWQEAWDKAPNPFEAWQLWKARSAERTAAISRWAAAKDLTSQLGYPEESR